MPSRRRNPWPFLVAALVAAGTQAAAPADVQGQDPATSFAGARVRLALRNRPDRWLVGTLVGQSGDSLRLDERGSHRISRRLSAGAAWRRALNLSLQF